MSEKVASLKDRVLDLLKEIEQDAELALAPEIAQVNAGLNSAHKWLDNLAGQSREVPVEVSGGTPVEELPSEQPTADNDHVEEGSEEFGQQ